eukprot:1730379-Pyramimonas_sp.AAC.1
MSSRFRSESRAALCWPGMKAQKHSRAIHFVFRSPFLGFALTELRAKIRCSTSARSVQRQSLHAWRSWRVSGPRALADRPGLA